MNRRVPQFQMLSVPAVINNGRAILLDRQGNILAKEIPVERASGPFDARLSHRWIWLLVARDLTYRALGAKCRSQQDPWRIKANSLAHSVRLRAQDCTKPRGRCRFEKYKTSTWAAAAKRLWEQAHNRYRRHARGGWNLWAHTTASNHNKRKGGRYGRT